MEDGRDSLHRPLDCPAVVYISDYAFNRQAFKWFWRRVGAQRDSDFLAALEESPDEMVTNNSRSSSY